VYCIYTFFRRYPRFDIRHEVTTLYEMIDTLLHTITRFGVVGGIAMSALLGVLGTLLSASLYIYTIRFQALSFLQHAFVALYLCIRSRLHREVKTDFTHSVDYG